MNLKYIFRKSSKYSFLAGAGISHQHPSNLPLAKEIIRRILNVLNIDDKLKQNIETSIAANELRFEQFIEKLKSSYDHDLHILDILAACDAPNAIHSFLASSLKHGHNVFTTNFDLLIERAAKRMGIPVKTIFDDASFLVKEFDADTLPIWKLHGSLLNEKEEDVRQSMITTITQIGKFGEAFNFAKNKRAILAKTLKTSDLVVLGYSGSDDYDIIPAIAQIKTDRNLIWLMHSSNTKHMQIINLDDSESSRGLIIEPIETLLSFGVWQKEQIYVIASDTPEFCKTVTPLLFNKIQPNLETNVFEVPDYYYQDWKFEYALEHWRDLAFAAEIYSSLGHYSQSVDCYIEALAQPTEVNELSTIAVLNSSIAVEYIKNQRFENALVHIETNQRLFKKHGLEPSPDDLINLAICYRRVGRVEAAVDTLDRLPDSDETRIAATTLYEKASIKRTEGDHENALRFLKRAFLINEKLGRLEGVIRCLMQIIQVLSGQYQLSLAMHCIGRGLRICELTKNKAHSAEFHRLKSHVFHRMGLLYSAMNSGVTAFETFKELNLEEDMEETFLLLSNIKKSHEKKLNTLGQESANWSNLVVFFIEQVGSLCCENKKAFDVPSPEELLHSFDHRSKEKLRNYLKSILNKSMQEFDQAEAFLKLALAMSPELWPGHMNLDAVEFQIYDILENKQIPFTPLLIEELPRELEIPDVCIADIATSRNTENEAECTDNGIK
jgi:tetratricopeptide (TPR) repeat protein